MNREFLGGALMLLASKAGRYMTGTVFLVDRGQAEKYELFQRVNRKIYEST